jgi:hypothetical protein
MNQQRQLLEPFPKNTVKQVDKGSYKADYVSWTDKIQRLLQVLGWFDWEIEIVPATWNVVEKKSRSGNTYDAVVATSGAGAGDEPVAAIGTLIVEIDGRPRRIQGVGTGKDAKTAETDAFARACAKIGVGLHLWTQGGTKDGGYWIAGVLDKTTDA